VLGGTLAKEKAILQYLPSASDQGSRVHNDVILESDEHGVEEAQPEMQSRVFRRLDRGDMNNTEYYVNTYGG
jgi:hypothetical protein